MRSISCVYDNPSLRDRYTVIFNTGEALALSGNPDQDQGFARWILVDDYDEDQLGHTISFDSLPRTVQEFVIKESNRKQEADFPGDNKIMNPLV